MISVTILPPCTVVLHVTPGDASVAAAQAALAAWQGCGGVPSQLVEGAEGDDDRVDGQILIVPPELLRQAAIALCKAGHVVGPAKTVLSLPLTLGADPATAHVHRHPPTGGWGRLAAVPPSYLGLWRMVLEQVGGDDAPEAPPADEVLWLQTHSIYHDMRIPKEQLRQRDEQEAARAEGDGDGSAASAEDPSSLAARLEHYSFGGWLEVEPKRPDVCTWHRLVSFYPANGIADVGLNSFSADGATLRERSMPGHYRTYVETWERLDDGSTGLAALELEDDGGEGCTGFWVFSGPYFSRVVGRPGSRREGAKEGETASAARVVHSHCCSSLAQLIEHCRALPDGSGVRGDDWRAAQPWSDAHAAAAVRSYVAHFGRVECPGNLRVVRSFDPSEDGTMLVGGDEATIEGVRWASAARGEVVESRGRGMAPRTWRVVERSKGYDPLALL